MTGSGCEAGAPRRAVTVEFEPHDDVIEGVVHRDGESSTRFRGWLELSSVLERCRRDAAGSRDEPDRLR